MIIVLNENLIEDTRESNIEWMINNFYNRIFSKLDDWKKEKYSIIKKLDHENVNQLNIGYLELLSECYSNHRKVVINPHDIWYILLTEIASIISNNIESCRPLFTKSKEKTTILIPVNDVTNIDLNYVVSMLKGLIPVDIDIFIPSFSTDTVNSKYAFYAAFCDGMKHYYDYMTFCCGIHSIKVNGTDQDYSNIQTHFKLITDLFDNIGIAGIKDWYNRIDNIISNIRSSLAGEDNAFWENIYTHKNIGSGNELLINGWFSDIYYKKCDFPKLGNFPTTISQVPYVNLDTGRKFIGVSGCFIQKRDSEGFIHSDYGQIILEKLC